MACNIGLTVYAILEAIAFVFMIVGTPIDQFRGQKEEYTGNTPCLSLWGYKEKCYSTTFKFKPKELFANCPSRLDRFKAAEAMSIVSIGVFFVAAILAMMACCCCSSCACCLRVFIVIFTLVGIASGATVWGCMVASYTSTHGSCAAFKDTNMKYGAGFALVLVAWILNTFNLVMALLPC